MIPNTILMAMEKFQTHAASKHSNSIGKILILIYRLVEESDLEIAKQAFGESTVSLYLNDKHFIIKQRKTIIN